MTPHLQDPDRDVNLIVVYNPFDVTDQAREKLVWNDGKTLADYLDGLPLDVRWAVTVNAEIIEPDAWISTVLEPDDYIVLVPVPLGGSGGGKTVIRMVALLAVAVLAAYAGPLAGAAMFGAGTTGATVAGGIVAGTIGNAGSLSINTLLPGGAVSIVNATLTADAAYISADTVVADAVTGHTIELRQKLIVIQEKRFVASVVGTYAFHAALAARLATHPARNVVELAEVLPDLLRELARTTPDPIGRGNVVVLAGFADDLPAGFAFDGSADGGNDFETQVMVIGGGHVTMPGKPVTDDPGYPALADMWMPAAAGVGVEDFHIALARNQHAASERGMLALKGSIGGSLDIVRIDRDGVTLRNVQAFGQPEAKNEARYRTIGEILAVGRFTPSR